MADSARFPKPENDPVASRRAALRLLRIALFILMIAVTMLTVLRIDPGAGAGEGERLITGWGWALAFAVTLAAAVLAFDILTPAKKISTLSGVFLGLIAGLTATIGAGFLIDLLAQGYRLENSPLITTIKALFGVAFCYLGISIVLQTQDDFRLVIPYVEFAKQVRGMRPLLLDTSALIDARIIDLAETGVLQAPLVIPRFVVNELQTLADSEDRSKRSRGRRGLDVVSRLQRAPKLDVSVSEAHAAGKSVDQMLVELARQEQAIILTGDTGLARVARIHSAPVVSLNDLAIAMRSTVSAGDTIVVRLLRAGEHAGQAVGYLDDGQMVVAENGAELIGREAPLTVTGTVQTSAGRLVFARAPSLLSEEDRPEAASPGEPAQDPGPGADEAATGARPGPPVEPRARGRRGARNPRRG